MTIDSMSFAELKTSAEARDDFLALHKPFVAKVASKHCGRYLIWGRDDELSVGLIALNQALDAYKPDSNVPFLAFARRVIERKLTDFFRKETRHHHLSLNIGDPEEEFSPSEFSRSWDDYLETTLRQDRAEEIVLFSKLLAEYQVCFADLEFSCPKHRDSRELLTGAAHLLVLNPPLMKRLVTKKQVPIKDLAKICNLSPKTLEKSRKYIVATALLLLYEDEFLHLREFVPIPRERRA
ncbi:MAG TPA: sigma-70 family RNA polymerase sigma factor [Verrucomicrobiae bacterium]|nr:sigma-70 family RNA polymerase sigma factor [Verrucomicrobiae bacterium]